MTSITTPTTVWLTPKVRFRINAANHKDNRGQKLIIWITGLSCSGKSTLGRHVIDLWKAKTPNTVLIDGDEVRRVFLGRREESDYTLKGRLEVAESYHEICGWLDGQDINVVCCTMSLFDEIHRQNRETFSEYFEVYLKVSMKTLQRRDNKNLYGPASRGEVVNVIGVDLPFDPPRTPDMVIENEKDGADLAAIATSILEKALS